MSIESMSIALHHSRAAGTAKLVLIGIANHDGDGGAWPSVRTLAKYAGVSPRNVQKAIATLESLNEIRRELQGGGTARMGEHERPNLYHFLLRCPPDCDRSSKHNTRRHTSVEMDIYPLSVATPAVVSDVPPVTPPTPEPSHNLPHNTPRPSYVPDRVRESGPTAPRSAVDLVATRCVAHSGEPFPPLNCLPCAKAAFAAEASGS